MCYSLHTLYLMDRHAAPVNTQLVSIHDHKTQNTPQNSADLKRQIVSNQLDWAGKFARLHHRAEPKNAVQNHRRGVYQLIRENLDRPLVRRIEQKTNYRQTTRDIQHVPQQFRSIAPERFAKLLAVLPQLSYLAATLPESKKQAQRKRAQRAAQAE